MTRKLLYNGTIITCNDQNDVIKNGAIAIDNGIISYVGESPHDREEFTETVDLKGDILLPGFINTHGHTPDVITAWVC